MSPPKHEYYETLGVPRTATADDIRKPSRKLARKYHPALNPGDKSSEDRFKNVQEAYDVLSDPKKRPMYDQYGFYSENGLTRAGPGRVRRQGRRPAAPARKGLRPRICNDHRLLAGHQRHPGAREHRAL